MSAPQNLLAEHLATGLTSICRCWSVTRRDGTVMGFTDHDRTLSFDGIDFKAETGMTARAVEQVSGLAVDNSEVVGALTSPAIGEQDVAAGRFDGAEVREWLVNWQAVTERVLLFRGTLGEITRSGGEFRAELRGLSEALNQPRGRAYQPACPAVLGDADCGFDLAAEGFFLEAELIAVEDGRTFYLTDPGGFEAGWFSRGTLRVQSGAAAGLVGLIKSERSSEGILKIELWETLRATVLMGDQVRIEAGCDKRAATCREKFGNFLNFRGFPTIPGEDWLLSYPREKGVNDGGSLSS